MKQVQPLRVLLIDDDREDYLLTRDILGEASHQKYSLEWAESFDGGLEFIKRRVHDVYLVDYRLGASNGLELIEKAIADGCEEPLILLTGLKDNTIDELAVKAGAADYLVKGALNAELLDRSIRYSIAHSKNLKAIRQFNTELERRVQERTEELADAINKLAESKNEVMKALAKEKQLNELKSRFITTASHEFRTPLGTILSSASLISKYENAEDAPKRKKHIDRIRSSVSNLTEILNDFLSLGRLEEGAVRNIPVQFNVEDFVKGIIEEVKPIRKEKQVFIYRHTSGEKQAELDNQILKNTLLNLISNAIKYSPEGSEITIISECSNGELTFSIKDRGIGIPEEDKQHLFERFFRAHNAANIQGTGLGLNIVKKYVELLQGKISFESRLNEGTTFYLRIPRKNN